MKFITRFAGAIAFAAGIFSALFSCSSKASADTAPDALSAQNDTVMNQEIPAFNPDDTTSVKVKLTTSLGDIVLLLYGDTPRHRDNFVKLVKEGYYDNTLFHRVIDSFMIQAGDPLSRTAAPGQRLGTGGPDYTIEAEINFPTHFHKRGALAAARQGDQVNPTKRSSGSQFYIVTGKRILPAQLDAMKIQLKNKQMQSTFNGLASSYIDEIRSLQAAGDTAALRVLQEKLIAETEKIVAEHPLALTPEMEKAYTEIGGTPHLDGDYTVFGEVLQGMDVIEKIEKAETDPSDRPKEDIRILSTEILK